MENRVGQAILFIATNFRDNLTLERISEEAGMSKFHFHRLFKDKTGETPLHYINRIKLEYAAHFLKIYPHLKLIEASIECGYSSPSVFSREFKRYYNISPIDYKKRFSTRKTLLPENKNILPITYLNKIIIQANASNLERESINKLFKNIIKSNGTINSCYGVYYDLPIHQALESCRYFAGIEINPLETKPMTLTIDEGYYTYLDVSGDFNKFTSSIIDFKKTHIDTSHYQIASLIAFEKFPLKSKSNKFDYFSSKRRVFIKIKRK